MRFRVVLAIVALLVVACKGSAQEDIDPCDDLEDAIGKAVRLRRNVGHREAEALYMRTLEDAIARECRLQEAQIRKNLSTLFKLEGRLTESLRHLDEAQAALSKPSRYEDKSRRWTLQGRIASARGDLFVRLGWLDQAELALRKARASYSLGDPTSEDEASVLLFIARKDRLKGDPKSAAEALAAALKLTDFPEPTRSALYMEQARLALDGCRFKVAQQALEKARELLKDSRNPLNLANVIADHAELEGLRGQWTESLRHAERALELVRAAETPDLNLEAHAHYLKSMALWKLGESARSRRAADVALALLEGARDAWQDLGFDFLANRQSYYRHRLDLAVRTEDAEASWTVFEGYRAQGLLESVRQRALGPSSIPDADALEAIRKLRQDLIAAARDLDALGPDAAQALVSVQEARFHERRLALRRRQADQGGGSQPAEIGPAAAAEMLASGTLALAFAAGVESVYVLLVDHEVGIQVFPVEGDLRRIEDRAREIVRGLDPYGAIHARQELDRNVDELSRSLLGPLGDRVDAFHRLVIVADGPLEELPFEVLRDPRSGQRLVASHEIAYLPSFSVLAAARARTCSLPEHGLFALGDSIFGASDERWSGADDPRHDDEALLFQRLPASAVEVENIAGIYGDDATVVLGGDATRERFLAEARRHRTLHVASHARSDRQAPERSRIALSCLDAEGRVPATCDLYFEDVAALDLCGQVVVLSACDTAGGRPLPGEGILGLPWAFLRAGAGAVVASRWRVADEPTAMLMITFHRHLRAGAGPAAALRQAKLELIAAGRRPSDWAALVLLGDWRSAPSASSFSSPSSTFSSLSGPIQ